jgi:hypothetical protein
MTLSTLLKVTLKTLNITRFLTTPFCKQALLALNVGFAAAGSIVVKTQEAGGTEVILEDKDNMTQSVNVLNMKSGKKLLLSGKWSTFLARV